MTEPIELMLVEGTGRDGRAGDLRESTDAYPERDGSICLYLAENWLKWGSHLAKGGGSSAKTDSVIAERSAGYAGYVLVLVLVLACS